MIGEYLADMAPPFTTTASTTNTFTSIELAMSK
ncbi:hypothetical protein E2C01_093836 [Portunus trituberculatus]|uniref:Uncharacterized protein n=1 Tax=Portunus trituberculatus TaxID=210409 RepID=A0A5B7JVA3_PORTR|nr:hypothetical protein [Portunus trituberculatus]